MTASSILPCTIHNGKLLFLFGLECPMEDSAKGYSDFGGGINKGDNIMQAAIREGVEEMTGFLGSEKDLANYIKKNGGTYDLVHKDYHVHIIYYPYDKMLPVYYNNTHRFCWTKMDQKYLNKTKYFEKIKIEWFSVKDMIRRKKEFRKFYQEFLDLFVLQECAIKTFIKKNSKKRYNKTIKKN